MSRSSKIKWSMLITMVLMDVLITSALVYSVLKSRVLISGNNPFILNMAMILAIIDVLLWVITILMMYEVRTDSTLTQRVITLERILMDRGLNRK